MTKKRTMNMNTDMYTDMDTDMYMDMDKDVHMDTDMDMNQHAHESTWTWTWRSICIPITSHGTHSADAVVGPYMYWSDRKTPNLNPGAPEEAPPTWRSLSEPSITIGHESLGDEKTRTPLYTSGYRATSSTRSARR